MSSRQAVIAVLLTVLVAPALAGDRVELVKVATLPRYFAGFWPCYDANHNGRPDVFGTYGPQDAARLLVCEQTWGNRFRIDSTGLPTGRILDVSDVNSDSLCYMLAWQNWLGPIFQVWKAVSPDSYPTRLVSVDTPPFSNIYYGQFYDLTGDGRKEILISGFGLFVYKDLGQDSWVRIPFPRRTVNEDIYRIFAVGSFGPDHRTEIVGGNDGGEILLYKCFGGDSFARVCSLNYHPNSISDYWHAAANDMDSSGWPKIISLFRRMDTQTESCWVRMYEEHIPNQLACVCSLTYEYSPGDGCVAAGNVDGSGRDMFAVSNGIDVRLFRSTGLHQYAETWRVNWRAVCWMRFYDVNLDDRDELIISCGDSTYIYEDTAGLGVSEFNRLPQAQAASVQPTVARLGIPVQFCGISPSSDIEVHSLDGRLVRKTKGVRQSSWTWDLRNQAGSLVPAGTYFAVVRARGKSTSLKLCLVK